MIVSSYSFIDASTEEYQEEEVYFEEEEENFDHCTTQGKLYYCKLLTMQANILASYPNAKLYYSKAPLQFYSMSSDPLPNFILASFTLFIKAYFYS